MKNLISFFILSIVFILSSCSPISYIVTSNVMVYDNNNVLIDSSQCSFLCNKYELRNVLTSNTLSSINTNVVYKTNNGNLFSNVSCCGIYDFDYIVGMESYVYPSNYIIKRNIVNVKKSKHNIHYNYEKKRYETYIEPINNSNKTNTENTEPYYCPHY